MNVLFRADASVQIGTGHVMRCIALAQAWHDSGGRAIFAMAQSTPAIRSRLAKEECELLPIPILAPTGSREDAAQTIANAREHEADWVVVDGYEFDAEYQKRLKTAGLKVLFIDDYGHASSYAADIILNQNVGVRAELYAGGEKSIRLLLGTRYAMLRREFAAWREWKREIPQVARRLLVMMGGSDPENLTLRVIKALELAEVTDVETTIVIGGSNPHFAELKAAADQSTMKLSLQRDVANIAELMATSDAAVSAAGSTCWELCMLGLPALLIDIAENQSALARELNRRGCAIHVGNGTVSGEQIADQLKRLLDSQELRRSFSERSRQLVDGNGARRVASALLGVDNLRLRRATIEDAKILWGWVNDAEVRAASFSSALIPWDDHVVWLRGKLEAREQAATGLEKAREHESLILIAEDEIGKSVGQIRFDARSDGEWEVDVSVDRAMRGHGLGQAIIRIGVQEILRDHPQAQLHAYIKSANTASIKSFQDADFKSAGATETRGHVVAHLVYENSGSQP